VIWQALNNSNDPVLALGANFSLSADSHLVAMQTPEASYQTQAINILNKVIYLFIL
jgi:MAD (mothers against decapentaplegic) interacting protein